MEEIRKLKENYEILKNENENEMKVLRMSVKLLTAENMNLKVIF